MRMSLGENARMALTTLRENKMRSFLTVLGVVIGITALLSVVAVLMGVYNDVNAFLSDFGSDTRDDSLRKNAPASLLPLGMPRPSASFAQTSKRSQLRFCRGLSRARLMGAR